LTPAPPTDIYTLSLHDALPISTRSPAGSRPRSGTPTTGARRGWPSWRRYRGLEVNDTEQLIGQIGLLLTQVRFARRALEDIERRSEEHTSELQSLTNLVCRLLL